MDMVLQAMGVMGVGLIILAFYLQQRGRWTVDTPAYHVANMLGAGGILLSLIVEWNMAQCVIEVFWFIISAVGLANYYRIKNKGSCTDGTT